MKLLFMNPVLKHNIWGGSRLRTEYGYSAAGEDIGECWGIAAHPHGDCTVREGEYAGKSLSWLWKNQPEIFGKTSKDTEGKVFPLLIKIIDARQDLSIQVHPDDAYADIHENHSLGKTECWYILHCGENAELVVGHNAKTREELQNMIRTGSWEKLIRTVPVREGDLIEIEPGTVHSIKGGIVLLETQQNSDITYRLYDYGRLVDGKPRELHLDKCMDVITVPAKDLKSCLFHTDNLESNRLLMLYECDYYRVYKLAVTEEMSFEKKDAYLLATVVEGSGYINGEKVKKGDNFIIPFGVETIHCTGEMELIMSTEV